MLIPLSGHTRGHAAVAIKNGSGWLLHAGDGYFDRGTIDRGAVRRPGMRGFERMVATDYAKVRENHRHLRSLLAAQRENVQIFCAHDERELPSA